MIIVRPIKAYAPVTVISIEPRRVIVHHRVVVGVVVRALVRVDRGHRIHAHKPAKCRIVQAMGCFVVPGAGVEFCALVV